MTNALQRTHDKLRVGLFINPYAGAGGPQALKGSDALAMNPSPDIELRAAARACQFLSALRSRHAIQFVVVEGVMGTSAVAEFIDEQQDEILALALANPTTAEDTKHVCHTLMQHNIDLLMFAGGDGTARDVCSAIALSIPVLGVPAGVKMHSGVFAISPQAAAKILDAIACGELVSVDTEEVRDIDEAAFQQGTVKSRHYGALLVPQELRFIQHMKQGGIEVDELVLMDIAHDIQDRMTEQDSATLYIFAPGSTTHYVLQSLGCEGTLLGVDVYSENTLLLKDANAKELDMLAQQHQGKIVLVLTAIGGQGHIIGRGNQQLTPELLKLIGRENLWVIATKTKLMALESRPLVIDSGDPELDEKWEGLIPVITGYRDSVLYRIGLNDEAEQQV